MTSTKFVFYLTCFLLGKLAQMNHFISSVPTDKDNGFKSANVGDNLTLQCLYNESLPYYYWFKLTLGQMPQLISSVFSLTGSVTMMNEFKNNPRFSVRVNTSTNVLHILNIQLSDSATYLCLKSRSYYTEFLSSVTVSVQGSESDVQAVVHQSGGSGTLSCTVHTGTCDGEHRVYWFKNSEDSKPGLVYTNGKDQCERNPDTHTCTYDLPPNASHPGSYHCAVASCGHIVFGSGTKVDDDEEWGSFLKGSIGLNVILVVGLGFCLCVINKRRGSSGRRPSTINDTEVSAEINGLRRRRDDTWTQSVFRVTQ